MPRNGRTRHWQAGACLSALALLATGCAEQGPVESMAPAAPATLEATPWLVAWSATKTGVRGEFDVTPASDREYGTSQVMDGTRVLARAEVDYAGEPFTLDPQAWKKENPIGTTGVPLHVQASFTPDCTAPSDPPLFVLRWHEDGTPEAQIQQDLSTLTPKDYRLAVDTWCTREVRTTVAKIRPLGDSGFEVELRVRNDSDREVRVASPTWVASRSLTWRELDQTVPAHSTHRVVLTGVGTCRAPGPFQNGRLTVGGVPLRLELASRLCADLPVRSASPSTGGDAEPDASERPTRSPDAPKALDTEALLQQLIDIAHQVTAEDPLP